MVVGQLHAEILLLIVYIRRTEAHGHEVGRRSRSTRRQRERCGEVIHSTLMVGIADEGFEREGTCDRRRSRQLSIIDTLIAASKRLGIDEGRLEGLSTQAVTHQRGIRLQSQTKGRAQTQASVDLREEDEVGVVVVIPREDTQTTEGTPRELVISIFGQNIGRTCEDHTRAGRTALREAIEDRLRAGQTTQRPRSQRTDARHAADAVGKVRTKLGEELLELIKHHAWSFLSDISCRVVESSREVIKPVFGEVLFGSVASRE